MRQINSANINNVTIQGITLTLALSLLSSIATFASSEQTSQLIKLSENKRIEASICANSMNRIAVANDRITQLFGDDGTFESQNDETTGQIFIKPTIENGSKNLSLTLITEQGITQDLTLKPDTTSAKTLILIRDSADQTLSSKNATESFSKNTHRQHNLNSHLGFTNILPSQEESRLEQILTLLKQAMNGQLPASEEEYAINDHLSSQGYALMPNKAWQAGPYIIHAINVGNVTDTHLPLQEKEFYQPGDLALSFDTRIFDTHAVNAHENPRSISQPRALEQQKEVTLYVVRLDSRVIGTSALEKAS